MVDFWRAKGTAHTRYPDMIYPLDYGYLDGTTAADSDGIDVWLGSGDVTHAAGIICTLDAVKRDAEIKLLLGCSPDEMQSVIDFFQMNRIGSLLVKRQND